VRARFRYCGDGLFLASSALYVINRWLVKPYAVSPFLRGHFNDLLLIPCALPPLLWLHRLLGLRAHDSPPTVAEIAVHWFVWSLVCEVVGPAFLPRTADVWDILCYAVGALVSGVWWMRCQRSFS
jgi:hypothetical protein